MRILATLLLLLFTPAQSVIAGNSSTSSTTEKTSSKLPYTNQISVDLYPSGKKLEHYFNEYDREQKMIEFMDKRSGSQSSKMLKKYPPYFNKLVSDIEMHWFPRTTGIAKLETLNPEVLIRISILPNGALSKIEIIRSSTSQSYDQGAIEAVYHASPFAPIPKQWQLDTIECLLSFKSKH